MIRWVVAVLVWAGAAAAAVGLGVVGDNNAGSGTTTATTSSTTSTNGIAPPISGSGNQSSGDPIADDQEVTKTLPPAPTATPSPHGSLFDGVNLRTVLKRMERRFGDDGAVAQFGLYPGEADFVIVHDGGTAEVVRAQLDQPLDVSAVQHFSDDVQTVELTQIKPAVVAKVLTKVRLAGDFPADGITHVTLQADAYPGQRAGFRVYPATGSKVYRTLLTGGQLETTSG